MTVNWGCLAEVTDCWAFTSQLQMTFSLIREDLGGIESEWAMVEASIVEAPPRSCAQRVIVACSGGNQSLMANSGEESRRTEDGGLSSLVGPGVSSRQLPGG